jgi:hypothetical protein
VLEDSNPFSALAFFVCGGFAAANKKELKQLLQPGLEVLFFLLSPFFTESTSAKNH